MSRAARKFITSAALAFVVALSGCAAERSSYDHETAALLQDEVLEISQLSAEAEFASALLALTELEVTVKDVRARGLVTEERYESILAAVALVRADLEAAIAAVTPSPDPEPEPEPKPKPEKGGNPGNSGNNGNGNPGNSGNNGNKGNSGNNGKPGNSGNKGNNGRGNGNGNNGD